MTKTNKYIFHTKIKSYFFKTKTGEIPVYLQFSLYVFIAFLRALTPKFEQCSFHFGSPPKASIISCSLIDNASSNVFPLTITEVMLDVAIEAGQPKTK